MSAGPAVHDLQSVQIRRRDRVDADVPTVTVTARVAVGSAGDVRVTHRPVMAVLSDDSGANPRVEVHVDGGSSVVLEGPPLAALLTDAIAFLKDAASGAKREHDHVYGLSATFDIAMSPFVTFEQPAFIVAHARTMVHASGAVALRLTGEPKTRAMGPEHAPLQARDADRAAFDLQIQSKRGAWLAATLEEALNGLGPGPDAPPGEPTVG